MTRRQGSSEEAAAMRQRGRVSGDEAAAMMVSESTKAGVFGRQCKFHGALYLMCSGPLHATEGASGSPVSTSRSTLR